MSGEPTSDTKEQRNDRAREKQLESVTSPFLLMLLEESNNVLTRFKMEGDAA